MEYEFVSPGAFMMLKVKLGYGESLKAEAGAMVAMSPTIDVESHLEGGVVGGVLRMLARERFFFQRLVASRGPGEVLLAPSCLGEIMALDLDGTGDYILQKDGFFAASGEVDISSKVQGLIRGLLSGEGFFLLRASGVGKLFVSSFGAIYPLDVPAGEELVIDNGHLVAWPATADYSITKAAKGWISSWTSGEGFVLQFRGPGRVLIQSRNCRAFADWLIPYLPTKKG